MQLSIEKLAFGFDLVSEGTCESCLSLLLHRSQVAP